MRKLIIALALSTTAWASPAVAQDVGPYVGIEGGILIPQDPQWDYSDADVDIRSAYNVDLRSGLDVDLIAGYDLGMFRVEGELGYKRASVKDIAVDPAITGSFGVPYDVDGRSTAISAMLNGLVDLSDDRWGAYAGGGIGVARVRHRFNVPDINRGFSGSDSGLAWQVVAGVRVAVTDNVDLGFKYRHFRVPNLKYRWGSGEPDGPFRLDGNWKSNSFLASVIYNLAAPLPPPPVIVTPPPPPPLAPATQTCPDGTVILATEMCPALPPPPPPPPPAPERG